MRLLFRKRRARLKMVDNMTRRQRRFLRRNAKRLERQNAFLVKYDDFDIVCNRKNLFEAADEAKKNVMWKASVQHWSISQLLRTEQLYRDLKAGKDVRKGFSRFCIRERGKVRNISAVRFYERVVQKCLCQKVLYPVFTRPLLFDNSASQAGKGVKFANDRLVTHLRRHYKKYGNNGYALLVDFKGYFENINHQKAKENSRKYLSDKKILKLIDDFIDAYGACGLGLGSETSQVHAIAYPNQIDHFITENNYGQKLFAGRYMDDSYVIAKDKSTLCKVLDHLKKMCQNLKIKLSPKKTMIVRLKDGIKWLKTKFFLLANGKIIKKPCHNSIVWERKKLKKQLKLLNTGAMTLAQLKQSFESWAGSMKRRNARLSVWKMRQIIWRNQYE